VKSGAKASWFVSGVLIACCGIALATERVQRRFDSTTGLAVSTIFSLAQDAEGFIWIGTVTGTYYVGIQEVGRGWVSNIDRTITICK
jgi:ligand-binding sensor domain-containing protein